MAYIGYPEPVKAFVDAVLVKKDGTPWAIKTSELHYKKDGDEFVKDGRTFRTVRAGYGAQIDFGSFAEGDKVEFNGKEKTVTREYNGKNYYDLVVDAESVVLVKPAANDRWDAPADWKAVDPDAPF